MTDRADAGVSGLAACESLHLEVGDDRTASLDGNVGFEEPAGDATLVEALDRLLATGVVVEGEVIVSVADIDLLYVGLNLVLASVESLRRAERKN